MPTDPPWAGEGDQQDGPEREQTSWLGSRNSVETHIMPQPEPTPGEAGLSLKSTGDRQPQRPGAHQDSSSAGLGGTHSLTGLIPLGRAGGGRLQPQMTLNACNSIGTEGNG